MLSDITAGDSPPGKKVLHLQGTEPLEPEIPLAIVFWQLTVHARP